MRPAVVGAVVLLVGLGMMVPGGAWLVAIAAMLAYLLGRSDEHARRERGRGGYLHPSGEHPYGVDRG